MCAGAIGLAQTTVSDSVAVENKSDNFVQKIIRYFGDANKPVTDKKVDFSFIGGPAYSKDTKLKLGIIGAALYKSAFRDSLTPQSNSTLYAEVSITGYYEIGWRGTHISPRNKYRVNYDLYFNSFPGYFWGIGYENGRNDDHKTKFLQLNAQAFASIEWRLAENLFVGPALSFNWIEARRCNDWTLWDGQAHTTTSFGPGVDINYDSRDNINNAWRGWYASVKQRFFARFLFNKYCFSSTEITASHYMPLWKGAIFAANIHGMFTYGDTPWSMLPTFGGSHSMRGYYKGRYRDKNEADVTVELRQHVWRRNSVVAWVGAGTVFPDFKQLHGREILPNFGVGYRWEFKKRVNVRVDLGFGRNDFGLVFNVNEAF